MFEYTLEGFVNNGEGLTLALYTSDQNLDKRSTAKIQNGKFIFKGTSEFIRQLNVRFENDIERPDGGMRFGVYTEPGTTTVRFDVTGGPEGYRFSNYELIRGTKNRLARIFKKEFAKAIGSELGPIFSDAKKIDDKRRIVYAAARSRVFKVFDKYFNEEVSGLHVYLLKWMTDKMNFPWVFQQDLLSDKEIEKIKRLFSKIDPSLSKNVDYQILKASIEQLGKSRSEIDFVDYELESIGGGKLQLSASMSSNKFTILAFWHTNCGRCRVFNKTMHAAYETLKQHGIEIIGINVDASMLNWRNSTIEDEILWPNLYAGKTSDILARYRVQSFPANLVFDANLNFMDVSIRNKSELWKWMMDKIDEK